MLFFSLEGSHPICQMDKIRCVVANKHLYSGAVPSLNGTLTTMTIEDSPCDCLPDCQLQQYPTEITSAMMNRTYAFNTMNFL